MSCFNSGFGKKKSFCRLVIQCLVASQHPGCANWRVYCFLDFFLLIMAKEEALAAFQKERPAIVAMPPKQTW